MTSVPSTNRPPLLRRLGAFTVRRRRWILLLALLATVAAGLAFPASRSALVLSRWEAPGSESDQAAQVLAEDFGTGGADLTLLATAKRGTVDDPAVAAAGRALTRELAAQPAVAEVASYWSRGNTPTLRSQDGRQALVVARVPASATELRDEILPHLEPAFTRDGELIQVQVGGGEAVSRQISDQAEQDFVTAETLIFPASFLLLVLLLRRLAAAALPLGVGVFAMLGTIAILGVVGRLVEVTTFALNLTLVMGLGLGIDYSLFVLYRFREELHRGSDVPAAVIRTVETAGRTVLFSGVTVVASLAVLFTIPFQFLQSFAYAGISVVALGVVGAVVLLPAALAVLGHRAEGRALRWLPPRPRQQVSAAAGGFWHATAMRVMRRPVIYGGVAVVLLLLLGTPVLGLRSGFSDERILPPGTPVRQVQEDINAGFTAADDDAIQIVAPSAEDFSTPDTAGSAQLAPYAAALSRVDGIVQVDTIAGSWAGGEQIRPPGPDAARFAGDRGTWLSAVPATAALDEDTVGLVNAVRAVQTPIDVLVGGYPAELTDYRSAMLDRLPLAVALILAVTFAILFLMTGSVVLPAKATVLNLLSLAAMTGVLVWGFQEGNLAGLLGFTPTGGLEPSIPILMFCVAYGLSMDYEVFMLSRIKEERDQTGDDVHAVAAGLERSAPLITAAAGILALAFATYATSGVAFLQILGVGMAVAVLVDATVIRAVLVPAFMRLAGRANWWAPPPLRHLHARFGLHESDGATAAASSQEPPTAPTRPLTEHR